MTDEKMIPNILRNNKLVHENGQEKCFKKNSLKAYFVLLDTKMCPKC